jgi:hypothetical protein
MNKPRSGLLRPTLLALALLAGAGGLAGCASQGTLDSFLQAGAYAGRM